MKLKLEIGQDVWMQSGKYTRKGRVAKITELYVEVELFPIVENETKCFFRFHPNGKAGSGWEGLGLWEYIGEEVGMLQSDPRTPGTEFGPWVLISSAAAPPAA